MSASPTATAANSCRPGLLARASAFTGLMKLRLNSLVAVATGVGWLVAAPAGADALILVPLLLGAWLAACGTSALNMAIEGDRDRLMKRTRLRPVPAGLLRADEAALFGAALSLTGLGLLLATTTPLATLLTATTVALYVFAYTPLKTRSTWNTVVGAIPGALPPLIGWAAARGTLEPAAIGLFLIVFFWQFPHFLAIASIHKEDYRRGGFRMLPVVDPSGLVTAHRAVLAAVVLIPVGLLPALMGLSDITLYVPGALALGIYYLAAAVIAGVLRTERAWRWLLRASFIHLPGLLVLMVAAGLST